MDRVTRSPTYHAAGWAAVGGDWCGLEAAGTGKVGMAGGCRSQCRLDCTCRPGERAARLYGESGDLTGQNWPGITAATVGGDAGEQPGAAIVLLSSLLSAISVYCAPGCCGLLTWTGMPRPRLAVTSPLPGAAQ